MYSLSPPLFTPPPVHVCIGACVAGSWGPEVDIMCLSKWLLTIFIFRQGTSLNVELLSEIHGVISPLSASLVLASMGMCHCAQLCTWVLGARLRSSSKCLSS